MNQKLRRQWLDARIEDAVRRSVHIETESKRRGEEAPQPGDVFVVTETGDFGVQWAIIDRDPRNTHDLMIVPLDSHPLVGTTDVALPAESPTGASCLRCGFAVRLEARNLDPTLRTGFLSPEALEQVRHKRAEIAAGDVTGSSLQRETDAEPEYQRWVEHLAGARDALDRTVRDAARREQSPWVGQPSWSGETGPEDESWTVSGRGSMELLIQIGGSESADPEDLERLTLQLLAEVRELDVEKAELFRGLSAPLGAKSAEAAELGSLTVMVNPAVLKQVLQFLQEWSSRQEWTPVEIRAVSGQAFQGGSLASLSGDGLKDLARKLAETLAKKKNP